jgi:hypothetical protein
MELPPNLECTSNLRCRLLKREAFEQNGSVRSVFKMQDDVIKSINRVFDVNTDGSDAYAAKVKVILNIFDKAEEEEEKEEKSKKKEELTKKLEENGIDDSLLGLLDVSLLRDLGLNCKSATSFLSVKDDWYSEAVAKDRDKVITSFLLSVPCFILSPILYSPLT